MAFPVGRAVRSYAHKALGAGPVSTSITNAKLRAIVGLRFYNNIVICLRAHRPGGLQQREVLAVAVELSKNCAIKI